MTGLIRTPLVLRVTALVVALFGVYLTGGGAWLVGIGGSAYYVVAGLVLLATALLLWRGQRLALWLYAALLLGTLVWALAESGLDFWALAPRGDILVPLGVWLILPFVTRRLAPAGRAAPAALGAVVVLAAIVLGVSLTNDPHEIKGTASLADAVKTAPQAEMAGNDWTAYGGSNFGNRFSDLDQITPQNVGQLKLAWQFRTGDSRGPNDPIETTDEDTPLEVNGTVYACSPHSIVFAIDAVTGQLKWKFDPHEQHSAAFQHVTCRGVSYHATQPGAMTADGQPAPAECPHRIFLPTDDGFLYALNADDGTLCQGFGTNGRIDLKQDNAVQTVGFYEGTSPPVVGAKVLVMGGSVIDNWSLHVPSGAVRGFDVYSGKLLWVFDAGNHDPNEMPSATHQFVEGSPNNWAPSVIDDQLNMVYVPLGTGADDDWGGHRSADEERYDSALIALDLDTGKLVWSYQNVHHDLWDMDLPSQPTLADVTTASGTIPAIYVPAKTGNIFVLDRRNGQLIVPAPETPVPQTAAPGDHVSATQPFSQLSFRPRQKLQGKDMWGATMFDQLACRIMFHSLNYDGPFTAPSVRGTLVFPGDLGMFEWGGIAVDPASQVAIANPMGIPFVSHLVPRGPNNPATPQASVPAGTENGLQPMFGVPFAVKLNAFMSPIGLPCLQPPWGNIAAIDLKTNKVIWEHRVGTTRDSTPVPIGLPVGMPMLGGPMATAGGVAFLSGTADDYLRAFDMTTGKLLWEDRLPAGGQSTPMSYAVNGKQYILSVDGGHGSFGTKLGDYIRAYTLPAS